MTALWVIVLCGALSIVYAIWATSSVLKADAGNPRMQEIAAAVREGAQAYLKRQYMTIGLVGIVIFALLAYFLGMLGNLLPLPGGLGGVEGGMIGAFAVFGVEFNLAVLAVLTYRGIAFWLPTLPGALAYLQLRRTVARWREEEQNQEPSSEAAAAGVAGA